MNKQEKRYKMLPDGDLYRIRALIDFTNPANGVEVKAGELGGLIEKESNLSQLGNGWIHLGSKVTGDAIVEDAFIDGNSHIF